MSVHVTRFGCAHRNRSRHRQVARRRRKVDGGAKVDVVRPWREHSLVRVRVRVRVRARVRVRVRARVRVGVRVRSRVREG